MGAFGIPTRDRVSPSNQQIFDSLSREVGRVPNVLAILAWSEYALGNYLAFSTGKSSLLAEEREIVNLVVSQVDDCQYCLSAHSYNAKKLGFTDEQIVNIRGGNVGFDKKMDVLAKLSKAIVEKRGRAGGFLTDEFYSAGYDKGNMMDLVLAIGDATISNYLYTLTRIPIDYPVVSPVLRRAAAG